MGEKHQHNRRQCPAEGAQSGRSEDTNRQCHQQAQHQQDPAHSRSPLLLAVAFRGVFVDVLPELQSVQRRDHART